MLAALAADFAAIDGVTTTVILDSRQDTRGLPWTRCRIVPVREAGGDCDALAECCRDADWTVVIAPEFDGLLEARAAHRGDGRRPLAGAVAAADRAGRRQAADRGTSGGRRGAGGVWRSRRSGQSADASPRQSVIRRCSSRAMAPDRKTCG